MKKNDKKKYVLLAAGGTGGHVFPAQAIADQLIKDYKISLVTDKRGASFLKNSLAQVEKDILPVIGFTGSIPNKIHAISALIFSFSKLFFKFFLKKPSIVVGFGGYPSAPAIIAAFFHQIPTIIHEQNAVMGKANKFLAKFSDIIALSFKETFNTNGIARYKMIYTGNPIRKQILDISDKIYKKLDKSIFKILVVGGSQGAAIFSDILPKAIKLLDPKIQKILSINQQARQDLLQDTINEYKESEAKVEVKNFFEDIENLLYKCDLVIARSGAATVMEIIASRKPSILIPFAASQNNHQFFNAQFLAQQKAAILIEEKDISPVMLAETISNLITEKEKFSELQSSMKKIKSENATTELTNLIIKRCKQL